MSFPCTDVEAHKDACFVVQLGINNNLSGEHAPKVGGKGRAGDAAGWDVNPFLLLATVPYLATVMRPVQLCASLPLHHRLLPISQQLPRRVCASQSHPYPPTPLPLRPSTPLSSGPRPVPRLHRGLLPAALLLRGGRGAAARAAGAHHRRAHGAARAPPQGRRLRAQLHGGAQCCWVCVVWVCFSQATSWTLSTIGAQLHGGAEGGDAGLRMCVVWVGSTLESAH